MTQARLLVAIAVFCAAASAQKPAPPAGTVTGHVICGDTQRPARFAEVYLLPRENTSALDEKAAVGKLYMVNVNTALDGSFTTSLPPGEYYVVVHLDGYILNLQPDPDAKDPRAPLNYTHTFAKYPLVKVAADHTANAEITLTRGAVVSGRVLFEDGSPIVRQNVQIHPLHSPDALMAFQDPVVERMTEGQHMGRTDDAGRFRFSGLPLGKYVLSVTVDAEKDERAGNNDSGAFYPGGTRGTYLTVYAPSAWREGDAKPVEVHGAEVQMDDDIVIDTTQLHNVHGRVLSAVDHHPLSGGIVRAVDASTPPGFAMVTHIQPDGSYSLPNIPSGSYVLSVGHAADVVHGPDANDAYDLTVVKRYSDGKLPLIVADHDVIVSDLELPEQASAPK